jgi:hypothetical protein
MAGQTPQGARVMSGTFAEIRQHYATPEIAAIYADIKTVSGLPFVTLIWRRFVTSPGILSWALRDQ